MAENKVPRFLQVNPGDETVARRPHLHIDEVEEKGTALDVVRGRPLFRTKVIKKLKRQLAELEELNAFVEKKGNLNITKEELERIMGD